MHVRLQGAVNAGVEGCGLRAWAQGAVNAVSAVVHCVAYLLLALHVFALCPNDDCPEGLHTCQYALMACSIVTTVSM